MFVYQKIMDWTKLRYLSNQMIVTNQNFANELDRISQAVEEEGQLT